MANERHFCAALMPRTPTAEDIQQVRTQRAALLLSTKWDPGQTITASFLEGDAELRKRVESVALEWVKPGRANLNLKFVDEGRADIRIAFKQGDGSWSLIGTDCHDERVGADEPTMNYGWLTPDSEETEVRRVVLHEFGHALGLIHEHQNPQGGIHWNKAAVYHDLGGPPNSWSKETIDHNIFEAYDRSAVHATDVDRSSIMMYPIPKTWTTDGFEAGLNGELSPHDETLIANEYP